MNQRIIFFGTPQVAATILDALFEDKCNIVAVVTRPDKPVGRSGKVSATSVKRLAASKKPLIPIYQPTRASTPEFVNELKALEPDLFVVVAYGQLLKENLLAVPKKESVNVHASILPQYRGAAPVQRAIMAGKTVSGVTIMSMVLEMDAGDMLATRKITITDEMTSGELFEAVAKKGAEALLEVLDAFETDTVKRVSQDDALATFAPKVTLEDAYVDFSKPADELSCLIRGVTPKPGAWTTITLRGKKKRLLIKRARVVKTLLEPSGAILEYDGLVVACQENALSLLQIQLEGKKEQSAVEFLRGSPKSVIQF